MSKLSSAARAKLPASKMGQPKTGGYPMPDKNHARLAKSGASHALHVGNITKSQENAIDRKADRILGKGKK